MTVREGQGKKYSAEQDKTRNDSENRTGQEIITVRAGQGIVRAEQDKKSFSEKDKTRNDSQNRTG
jgi:hypothetical protein